MMLPTHVVVGLAIASPLLVLAPDHAGVALTGILVGSVLPDLDMYAGHRRSLHFPTGYSIAAVPLLVTAFVSGPSVLLALALLFVGAALHCRMDRYGGGLELRPWEGTSDRAVYDHVRGEWRPPKRWIRYDGAPEDVLLMVLLGAPLLLVLEGPFRFLVLAAMVVGGTYGLLRRRFPDMAPVVVQHVPEPVVHHVPERYRAGQ
jgi:hypothetical protein